MTRTWPPGPLTRRLRRPGSAGAAAVTHWSLSTRASLTPTPTADGGPGPPAGGGPLARKSLPGATEAAGAETSGSASGCHVLEVTVTVTVSPSLRQGLTQSRVRVVSHSACRTVSRGHGDRNWLPRPRPPAGGLGHSHGARAARRWPGPGPRLPPPVTVGSLSGWHTVTLTRLAAVTAAHGCVVTMLLAATEPHRARPRRPDCPQCRRRPGLRVRVSPLAGPAESERRRRAAWAINLNCTQAHCSRRAQAASDCRSKPEQPASNRVTCSIVTQAGPPAAYPARRPGPVARAGGPPGGPTPPPGPPGRPARPLGFCRGPWHESARAGPTPE